MRKWPLLLLTGAALCMAGFAVSYNSKEETVSVLPYTQVHADAEEPAPVKPLQAGAVKAEPMHVQPEHVIDLDRWNISNDGTHPKETTKGINRALQWVSEQGIREVLLPAGLYLIDKDSRIEMVSNLTFVMDPGAVIQKESNGYARYETMMLGPGVENVTLIGGTYKGDRDTHDYSSGGTHESGYGILLEGARNVVIDGVTVLGFTGDGICVGADDHYVDTLYQADFEQGGLDDSGKPVKDQGKIRSRKLSKTQFRAEHFKQRTFFQFARPKQMSKESLFEVFFYKKNGTFISKLNRQEIYYSDIPIPKGAGYYRVVFPQGSAKGVEIGTYAQIKSTNVIVRNSDISQNRRLGITIGGADQVLVTNNVIHDMGGTAPQGGIDVEGGFFPNSRIEIIGNTFYNNKAYDVILFNGKKALIKGNLLQSQGAIGVAVTNLFRQAEVTGNVFEGSNALVRHELSFTNNQMTNGWVKFQGHHIKVKGLHLTDSTLTVESEAPYQVAVEDVTIVNHEKQEYGLVVDGGPASFKDVRISGPSRLQSITGSGSSGTTFDRLQITDYNGKYGLDLPSGTYNNCVLEAPENGEGGPIANRDGSYRFNRCTFVSNGTGLVIAGPKSDVMVTDSQFTINKAIGYGAAAVYVQAANRFEITGSQITAEKLIEPNVAMIKINNYGAADQASDVGGAVIAGNSIKTNLRAMAISTVDAGVGAPKFDIRGNELRRAVLDLREVDEAQ
ncbi:right-handed parallel beta-helix repeat-containing protein [Paenibacillus gansuensis]|uniref:Right-handed parallel beta-helix repeat-containing protein n=1 Tax=Paenibacillus gansuensis TaxID=306542 RepID=A0ABW5PHE1_9BACL